MYIYIYTYVYVRASRQPVYYLCVAPAGPPSVWHFTMRWLLICKWFAPPPPLLSGARRGRPGRAAEVVRGNHLSNTPCVTHGFFKSCEECSK